VSLGHITKLAIAVERELLLVDGSAAIVLGKGVVGGEI
jgi:hypothetical protein